MVLLAPFHQQQNTEFCIHFLSLPCCPGLSPIYTDVPYTPFSDTANESIMFIKHQIQLCHGQTREPLLRFIPPYGA